MDLCQSMEIKIKIKIVHFSQKRLAAIQFASLGWEVFLGAIPIIHLPVIRHACWQHVFQFHPSAGYPARIRQRDFQHIFFMNLFLLGFCNEPPTFWQFLRRKERMRKFGWMEFILSRYMIANLK